MAIEMRPITPAVGADIYGSDVGNENDINDIKQAFSDHSVVAIRGLDLTPEDHISFAQKWDEINVNRFFKSVDGHPQIATVLKEPDQTSAIGETWHTDHSYDEAPAMCSMGIAKLPNVE